VLDSGLPERRHRVNRTISRYFGANTPSTQLRVQNSPGPFLTRAASEGRQRLAETVSPF